MLGNLGIGDRAVKSLQRSVNIGTDVDRAMPMPSKTTTRGPDLLEAEVVKLLTRFGVRAP